MKYIRCRDVGVDCDFEARGATTEDVLAQCARHAKTDHGMEEIPPELAEKVQAAIRDEPGAASA
jgi:predicted small metal-binding protein